MSEAAIAAFRARYPEPECLPAIEIAGQPKVEQRIKAELHKGTGILKVAKTLGVGHRTVQRIKASLG